MTVSVSSDDDDEEAKRFAFSLSFVMTRLLVAREFVDQAFARRISSARDGYSVPVPGIPGPRGTSARAAGELICG